MIKKRYQAQKYVRSVPSEENIRRTVPESYFQSDLRSMFAILTEIK